MAEQETVPGAAPESDVVVSSTKPEPGATDAKPENAEVAGASEETDSEPEKPPPNPRVREIIALRRRAQEAEARAAHFEQLASAQRGPQTAQGVPQFDVSAYLPPPPDPSKFTFGESDPGFIREAIKRDLHADALRAEMARRAAAQASEQQRATQRDQEIENRAYERLEEATDRIPDLRKHVGTLSRLPAPVGDVLMITLAESEMAPEIVRHLATNERDRDRIAGMTHAQAAFFIGRLEERLERSRAAATATNAPNPPKTLQGKGKAAADLYDPDLSMDEFAKRFQRRYYGR